MGLLFLSWTKKLSRGRDGIDIQGDPGREPRGGWRPEEYHIVCSDIDNAKQLHRICSAAMLPYQTGASYRFTHMLDMCDISSQR